MTTISIASDLHGNLDWTVPLCDILILGGDICPNFRGSVFEEVEHQAEWLNTTFAEWLRIQQKTFCVAVWGNHDWVGHLAPDLVSNRIPWYVLTDERLHLCGLNFYGTPWSRRFCNWAFNTNELGLAARYNAIPDNTDILISHGPPFGYGDLARDGGDRMVNVGSPSLLKRINEIKPQLTVYGHIHSGHGIYKSGGNTLLNASLIDEQYKMVNYPTVAWFDAHGKLEDINAR